MSDRHARKLTNSQTVSNAALAMLGAMAAILVVALDSRSPSPLYWILMVLAAASLVVSVILGGRGVAAMGGGGTFNRQAVFCLLGFLLFLGGMWFIGPSSGDQAFSRSLEAATQLGRHDQRLSELEESIRRDSSIHAGLSKEIELLGLRIDSVKSGRR